MDRLISPVGEKWETGEALASAISGWEQRAGYALPGDYRAFLISYNGGRPYPNMFRHTALAPEEWCENPTEHFVDPFYAWDRVVAWNHELGNRLPTGCLAIGADPGLLEIVLSLRTEDFGAIYSWVRSWSMWGSDENNYLCPQASSFGAFVASLFDDDEQNGYDYWHTPRRESLKRRLNV
ncbi:SMI1/KNR4 family protein [Luteimonas salinilitoris]|uniref:SMI1/KNR4 family protein n=1 Tax=Luteimonas salinilitoris TaxID=3237697 RepID=A0ABV4HTZ1_9GAMM